MTTSSASKPQRILPQEKKPLILLAVAFVLFKTGLEIVGNFAEVIYFRRLGVESLPLLYSVQPLAMVFVLVGFSLVADRVNRHKMLLALNLTFAAMLVAAGFLIIANWEQVYFLLYIGQQIFFALLPLAFWLVCSDLFDIRQAKRLFVLITASGLIGALLGNLLTGLLAGVFTPEGTITFTSLFFFVSAGFGVWLSRLGLAKSFVPPKVTTDKSFAPILPLDLFKQPFLRTFSILILITGLLEPVWRYELNLIANQSISGESTLIAFYGYFKGLATLIVILFQIFVAGKLIQKMGIPWAISTHPLGLVGIMLLLAAVPTLPVAVIAVAALGIIRIGFDESGRKAIIGIYPLHERSRVSSFERQMMFLSIFLGGLFLMWAVNHLTLIQMNWISAGLAAAWLLVFSRFRSDYAQTCLRHGQIPLAESDLPVPASNRLTDNFQRLIEPSARVLIQGAGLRDANLNIALARSAKSPDFAPKSETSDSAKVRDAALQIALRSSVWSVRKFASDVVRNGIPHTTNSAEYHSAPHISAQLDFAEGLSAWDGVPQVQKLILERRDAAAGAVLLLLEATVSPREIRTAGRMLRQTESRANGLEALDILLRGAQKNRMMSLFETAYTRPKAEPQTQAWDALALSPDPELAFWGQVWNRRAGKREYAAPSIIVPDELRTLLAETLFPPTGDEAMELAEKIETLRASETFAALTETELRVIATCAKEVHHAPDEVIVEEGQKGNALYIILEGHVELASVEEKKTLQALSAGGVFGEHALFTEEPYSLTAVTVSQTCLLVLERQTLLELIQYYPNISVTLLQNLAKRFEKASALLRNVWV
jgi:MFS family permease